MIYSSIAGKKDEKEKKDETSPIEKQMMENFLKKRQVFLWTQVDDESSEKVIKQLLFLDSLNQEDIYLYINSPGGAITSGLAIYDCMSAIKSDVVTIVAGQAASMGAVLAAGGAKGKRYAWKNARIMIHQPLISGQMYGPATDIEIQAEEMLRIRESLNKILSRHTGKTEKEIERDTERDNFMIAEEARTYGLIDKIENLI